MKNWCKIIETKDHSVLLQRLSDEEDGEHICISIKLDGVLATFKPSYGENEALADETYEKYSEKDAEKIVKTTLEMFEPEPKSIQKCTCKYPHNDIYNEHCQYCDKPL